MEERAPGLAVELLDHAASAVRDRAMDIEGPYVERCWTHIVGPTAVVLLRCLKWRAGGAVDPAELAAVIGAGNDPAGKAVWRALNRLGRYGLVYAEGVRVEVYRQVAPLGPNQLDRAPVLVREAHRELWGAV